MQVCGGRFETGEGNSRKIVGVDSPEYRAQGAADIFDLFFLQVQSTGKIRAERIDSVAYMVASPRHIGLLRAFVSGNGALAAESRVVLAHAMEFRWREDKVLDFTEFESETSYHCSEWPLGALAE